MMVSCKCNPTKQSRCCQRCLLDGVMILPIILLVICCHLQAVQSFQSIRTIQQHHHSVSSISTTTTATTTSMTPTSLHSDIDITASTFQRGCDHTYDYNSYSKIYLLYNSHKRKQKFKQLLMSVQNCDNDHDCEDISSDDDISLLVDTKNDNKIIRYTSKRRNFLLSMGVVLGAIIPATTITTDAFNKLLPLSLPSSIAWADDSNIYVPAIRPTVYRIDSTQPPTLLPLSNAREQLVLLQKLGMGSGTNKEEIVDDSINLNNMLNKAVFGTIDAVNTILPSNTLESQSNTNKSKDTSFAAGDCTFVALGIPSQPKVVDIELALNTITTNMLDQAIKKKKNTIRCAVGLACLPYSTQDMLNEYTKGTISSQQLQQYLVNDIGLSSETIALYSPVWETIQTRYNNNGLNNNKVDLIAMAPDIDDRIVAYTKGLQFINSTKRSTYVIDPNGFINQVNDPKFLMYTDRSLLKDNVQTIIQNDYNENNSKKLVGSTTSSTASNSKITGGFFAERILFHEAAATSLVNYISSSVSSSSSDNVDSTFITFFAPVRDVRYLNGINGRISRISQYVATATNSNSNNNSNSKVSSLLQKVNDNCITTILINPTSIDTLSLTKYLRLEIGTGPDSIQYQSKLCDYIWFSQSPKVNLLPRLMN